jgi:hypothetical protein
MTEEYRGDEDDNTLLFFIFSVHKTMTPHTARSKFLDLLLVPTVLSDRHKKYSFLCGLLKMTDTKNRLLLLVPAFLSNRHQK